MFVPSTATTPEDMFNGRVLVITGAGVSAESGIPTFRGKDGYWRNLDPTKLATPEAFAHDPNLVWDWYRERRQRIRTAQPNPAHQAIAKLATVENFVTASDCDLVIVAGTTALFGYIIDWALRARGQTGQLIEVNPEETSLSQFATRSFREPAGGALPRLVHELVSNISA